MKKKNILILCWHQVYLSSNAGGYIRLKEFIKRVPDSLQVYILDNSPSLFIQKNSFVKLITYDTPKIIKVFKKYTFLFWLFIETITAGFVIYQKAKKILQEKKCSVIYVPIGEFPQLYLPGIFLKRKFPHIKLIVDILNYELPESNFFSYFKKLRKSGVGLFRSIVTIVMFAVGYFLTNITLHFVDYIVTVSPELVKKIKKNYRKNTIDFTPSGVDTNLIRIGKKKYLGVYVGRVTTQKGIMDLINTWTEVVKKKKDALLAIAGHTDAKLLENLKKEIQKRNLTNNIRFFGQVSEEEKFHLLSESEIFLHLARYEPLFPVIGILEGLASGLYTIIYDMDVVSSQKKYLELEKALAVVKNGNVHRVTENIFAFSSLQKKHKQAIASSARKFAKRYDWNMIAKKEFDIIKTLAYEEN